MREAFEKVKAIIDGWDPVDLLTCCHAPPMNTTISALNWRKC